MDIDSLKAKRRYEIKKGCRHFEVRKIDPTKYREELLRVQVKAFSAYPDKYRPTTLNADTMNREIEMWLSRGSDVFGTFRIKDADRHGTIADNDSAARLDTEAECNQCDVSNKLVAYSVLTRRTKAINFDIEKTDPEAEHDGVNAATVYGILRYYEDYLREGYYICDGEKPINHETHFQDYLEKYFGFRKAYCKLNVKYRTGIGAAVKILYPFRGIMKSFDDNSMVHKINGVLKMEEIVREG